MTVRLFPMPRVRRGVAVAAFLALMTVLCGGALPAHADTNAQVAAALTSNDVYISPALPPAAHVTAGDKQRLMAATSAAASNGVTEKIALVSHLPPNYHGNTYAAANGLRQFLDLSGVLVLVSPLGIGVTSDTMTLNEIRSIEQKARPVCLRSYAACAVLAGQLAVSQTKSDKSAANKNAAILWLIILVILAAVIAIAVFAVWGRRRRTDQNLDELRQAASSTLSLADSAVQEIEGAAAGMPAAVRAEYDRALALREGAKNELERGRTPAELTQANQDAASAVLALQGVMRSLGIQSPLANPLNRPTDHRCFYCGRTDRPPYVTRTIDDGRGNSMQIEVCSVDLARLEQGRTPQIQTVQYNGTMVPWWAVPSNPYFYSYGGPTWQYWLPFMIGLDVGSWYGGGWGAGFDPDYDGGYGMGDVGSAVPDGGTVDPGTDLGAGDFGGWGGGQDYSSGSDSGWGGDSGGGDWGGDSGGGDWGGDSGGDSGGW